MDHSVADFPLVGPFAAKPAPERIPINTPRPTVDPEPILTTEQILRELGQQDASEPVETEAQIFQSMILERANSDLTSVIHALDTLTPEQAHLYTKRLSNIHLIACSVVERIHKLHGHRAALPFMKMDGSFLESL